MADSQNVQINLTAQDSLTPTLAQITAALKRLEQAGEENQAWVTQLSTLLGSQQQAAQGATQSTNQLAAAYIAMAQAIRDQTQGYTQAQAATLAYRQQQDQLRESLRQQREAQRAANEEARAAAASWQQMMSVVGGIGIATGLTALVGQIRHFLEDSVQLAAKMQDLNLSFRAIEGSAKAANDTLGFLFATSQRLGVEFVATADGFKRFDQAAKGTTLEGQNIRTVFENVLVGARALGSSSEQVSHAIVALEQILTKGRLSAEEYRKQLGNAIPGALKLMADGFGVTTQVMEQMIKAGIIPGEAALVAFATSMGKLGESAGPVERLSSTFKQLKNEITAWMTSLGEGISTTLKPFLDDLITISAEVRKLLDIKPPGQQGAPGANRRGFFGTLFPGLFTPDTLGMPAPGTAGPSELPGARPTAPLSFAPSQYDALIRREAERTNIDAVLFSRLIKYESNFDPKAIGPYVPGQGQARGLGQIMPGTGFEYGLFGSADLFDPEKNLRASASIFRDYQNKITKDFGTLEDITRITLAAYNAGIGNVEMAIRETIAIGEKVTYGQVLGRLPHPEQTGPYVERIAGPRQAPPGTTMVETPWGSMPAGATSSHASGGPGTLPTVQETMLQGMDKVIAEIPQLTAQITALSQSSLNIGGVLSTNIGREVDELVKKFAQIAEGLARFPALAAKMTPEQLAQVEAAGKQVALLKESLASETKRRDLLKSETEQLDMLILRRQAELLTQVQGQEAGARFLQTQTQALKERQITEQASLRSQETVGQQITVYEQRLAELTTRANALGTEVQVQRAKQALPQIEAVIARVAAFTGRPDETAGEAAKEQVAVRGAELAKSIEDTLKQVLTLPELDRIGPALQARLTAALTEGLAALPDTIDREGARQADLANQKLHAQIVKIGADVGAAGLSPLDAAIEGIKQRFTAHAQGLQEAQTKGPEPQDLALISQIQTELATQQEAEIDRVTAKTTLDLQRHITDLSLTLSGAADEPRQRDLLKIQQWGEDLRIAIEKMLGPGGLPKGSEALRPQIEALLPKIPIATERRLLESSDLYKLQIQVAHEIEGVFTSMWERIFEGGVTSFQSLGLMVVQTLQKLFAQVSAQIMNALLNQATGTTEATGGWAGALANLIVKIGAAALGAPDTATAPEAAATIEGFRNNPAFTGGPGGTTAAGGAVFARGLGTIRALAGGGIIDRPSFALLGENAPRETEAVVPMPNGSIPVQFTGQQQQQPQPMIIEIHNDYSNAVAPSNLKTGKKEIIQHVIQNISEDGALRRVIRQSAR